jgi:hypothetical protein
MAFEALDKYMGPQEKDLLPELRARLARAGQEFFGPDFKVDAMVDVHTMDYLVRVKHVPTNYNVDGRLDLEYFGERGRGLVDRMIHLFEPLERTLFLEIAKSCPTTFNSYDTARPGPIIGVTAETGVAAFLSLLGAEVVTIDRPRRGCAYFVRKLSVWSFEIPSDMLDKPLEFWQMYMAARGGHTCELRGNESVPA